MHVLKVSVRKLIRQIIWPEKETQVSFYNEIENVFRLIL